MRQPVLARLGPGRKAHRPGLGQQPRHRRVLAMENAERGPESALACLQCPLSAIL